MPWPLKVYATRKAALEANGGTVPVGATWPAPHLIGDHAYRDALALPPGRTPFFVKLPDGYEFCPYLRAWNPEQGHHGDGWRVTGELPHVTIEPSINVVGRYHGWIRNGIITDDCEGRTFADARAAA